MVALGHPSPNKELNIGIMSLRGSGDCRVIGHTGGGGGGGGVVVNGGARRVK